MQKAMIVAIPLIVAIALIVAMGAVMSTLAAVTASRSTRERTAQDFHGSF